MIAQTLTPNLPGGDILFLSCPSITIACMHNSFYIINVNFSKLYRFTYYHVKIYILLRHWSNHFWLKYFITKFLCRNSPTFFVHFKWEFLKILHAMLITLCKFAYHYSNLIRPFWRNYGPFLLKEALATILTKKIICFGNW
jgi:hypothetical protein